jgi:type IV pilus assembly protein PilA
MSFNQGRVTGMDKDQRGLTLIETMMVFAIIGILVTIAIPPAYQLYEDSQARAQVTEAINLLESAKAPIAAFHSDKGKWPARAEFDSLVTTQTGKYIASLTPKTLANGFQITAIFKTNGVSPGLLDNGTGRTLVLATTNGADWICNDNADATGGVPGLIPGNVLPQHRPPSCK